MKDRSLAKKMAAEYDPSLIESIIDKWVLSADPMHVHKFNIMFINRHKLAAKIDKDYGWD